MYARRATADDMETLVTLGLAMYQEAADWHALPYEVDIARTNTWAAIHNQSMGVWLLHTADTEIMGFLACEPRCMAFTSVAVGAEYMMYVLPQHRGCGAIRLILRTFEAWAREYQFPMMVTDPVAGIDPRLGPLLARMGFKNLNGMYYKELTYESDNVQSG